jgi:hypothetical protein
MIRGMTISHLTHDLLVERVQKALSNESRCVNDLHIAIEHVKLMVMELREFEQTYSMPKRMIV